MKRIGKGGTLVTEDGWVLCPECGRGKLLRLPPDGVVRCFAYCRLCRRERFLNIDLSLSHEPEPHDP